MASKSSSHSDAGFKVRDDKCGCTGARSCLLCEATRDDKFMAARVDFEQEKSRCFTFCHECGSRAWLATSDHSHHVAANLGQSIEIMGIELMEEVITEAEESRLVQQIDQGSWVNSQSGRRKQDYGPRVNFKKQKLSVGSFTGLPLYIKEVWQRVQSRCPVLAGFQAVELCNLEYDESRGSAIEPHFDDMWVWGERLVTLNYLSETRLTLTYPRATGDADAALLDVEIQIPMKRRSLLVLSSDARSKWMHCIRRRDVRGRRIATTWRELTPEFLPGGPRYEDVGRELLAIGSSYV